MAKCKNCYSCLIYLWVGYKRYLYCTLCRKVYDTNENGDLTEVTDRGIIDSIRQQVSGRVD